MRECLWSYVSTVVSSDAKGEMGCPPMTQSAHHDLAGSTFRQGQSANIPNVHVSFFGTPNFCADVVI